MTVQDVLTPNVKSCSPDTDLAAAAKIMWDGDCGTVPVVNEERKVVGILTDRDICIAAATRATSPANIPVREVMSARVYMCRPDDDVRTALNTMKEQRVRRLPVIDRDQRLAGIVSLNDLAARAECRAGADLPGEVFLDTMKAICAHPRATMAA